MELRRARPLLAALVVLASPWTSFAGPPSGRVDYRTFDGKSVSLEPWRGSNVVFLTASTNLDPASMGRLLAVFDRVRSFYRDATGRDPAAGKLFEGRATVAEVPQTCGAACGYLGATGIELTTPVFRDLYDGYVARGEVDQALPYEFGRNFWFYSPQLAPTEAGHRHAFVTGYAVFMRFPALDAAGVGVGSFRGHPGADFRRAVESLVDVYEADPKWSFTNTLAVGAAPPNPLGLNGTDLFASFCLRLSRDEGTNFVRHLWREVGGLPAATNAQQSIDHFVIAASRAARRDLAPQFADRWRWPVSSEARDACARGAAQP